MALKLTFHRNAKRLLKYVQSDFTLTNGDAKLLAESILYANVILTKSLALEHELSLAELRQFQSTNYETVDAIDIGTFAKVKAENGVYCFTFKDKDTAINMPGTRAFLKTFGFKWSTKKMSFVKKEGSVSLDLISFKLDIENMALRLQETKK